MLLIDWVDAPPLIGEAILQKSPARAPFMAIPTWTRKNQNGLTAALAAAALFGVSTPLAKSLVRDINPWMLAGLLYLGSGLGLAIIR